MLERVRGRITRLWLQSAWGVFTALLLNACAVTTPTGTPGDVEAATPEQQFLESLESIKFSESASSDDYAGADVLQNAQAQYRERSKIYPGTGQFINQRVVPRQPPVQQVNGEVTLNFEAANIRDVVKVVFDTLQENYTIDPTVQGEVTVQTSRPLPKDMLIPTLETLLRANNAALVTVDGLYKIVPLADAIPGNTAPTLSTRTGPGYSVRIFPLRYISALEMQKILEPFAPEGGILLVDSSRNLLILAGTQQELAQLQETIELFDVNWLRGMSVGMFLLENVESQTLATELENLFGTSSDLPLAGMFRFVPVTRLNGILVITPQPEFLKEASIWIERLDGSGGERLYIYEVQNGDAEYIATILSQVFNAESSAARPSDSGRVAPGLTPSQISTSPGASPSSSLSTSSLYIGEAFDGNEDPEFALQAEQSPQAQAPASPSPENQERRERGARGPTVLGGGGAGSIAAGGGGNDTTTPIRIIADVENNALLIWANAQNYDKIVGALRKLDITPRQVLIEVTVAEVSLTGRLRYGLQWFFTNTDIGGRYTGTGSLELNTNVNLNSGGALGAADRVFSYVLSKDGIVRAILDLLATESQVTILSTPQILVIDNQEAEIRVGNQQPVRTSTTISEGGNTTESISFKDTGVFLKVTPQVNSSGLVTMDILQEVVDVGQVDAATGQRAFFTRSISSKVAIQNGQSIVLGGLISETKRDDQRGIPVLYKLPVVGPLFGTTEDNADRTELLVLITPRVIQDGQEAGRVTEELKRRMKTIEPLTVGS